MLKLITFILLLSQLISTHISCAQDIIYFNTGENLYSLVTGSCTPVLIGEMEVVYADIAYCKESEVLYGIFSDGNVNIHVIDPFTAESSFLASFDSASPPTSLECLGDSLFFDLNNLSGSELYIYEISSSTFSSLGSFPGLTYGSGDLLFSGDELYFSSNEGLIEVDTADVTSSSVVGVFPVPIIDNAIYGMCNLGNICGTDLILCAGSNDLYVLDPTTVELSEYCLDITDSDIFGMTSNISTETDLIVEFSFSEACLGDSIFFENLSIPTTSDWLWTFGDGSSSTEFSPSHLYESSGTYEVQLVTDCGDIKDSIQYNIIITPIPEAEFEFVVGGVSSQDGLLGGCVSSEVQFNDLSTIDALSTIVSWNWDFGGDGTSTDENPTHTFSIAETYTVTLTVDTDNGCSSTFELDIIMTEGLALDLTISQPTCYGFSDGSITIGVLGGAGELTFEITDAAGIVLNEDNSNTANTLRTGWYYFIVRDDTECEAVDSVFINEPAQLEADLTIFNVLCYGDETGWARVDSVYNTQGDYGQVAYFWNPNTSLEEGIAADSIWNMGAGDYIVTINDDNGCSRVYDFTITEPDELVLSEFGKHPAYCRLFDYQNGNGVVFGAASGGTPDYSYEWTYLEDGTTSINSTWGGRNPGDYQLEVKDDNGCVLIQNVALDSVNPKAIFSVLSPQLNNDCQGTAPVEVEFYNNSINYTNPFNPNADTVGFWNLNTPQGGWFLQDDFTEIIDTTYQERATSYIVDVCLVVLNKNGCSDTTCKPIEIFKPVAFSDVNIFSPNGDGINDNFTFEFKSASISEFNCVIVNRWGSVVAELNNITDGWNGTNKNGDPCSNGVYFYTYVAITDNQNILKGQGNIQLVGNEY